MALGFNERRATTLDIADDLAGVSGPLSSKEVEAFEYLDLVYRSLCALMYNYVPTSGHPGGSISSGRFVSCLLFDAVDLDLSDPERADADIVSYAAGHKALGLYSMWALRNEIARIGAPGLLPEKEKLQLRLEDLLGFRRNPVSRTPLFASFHARPLDGHPTPAVPFVRLSTGASGVGVASSLGLAFGAADTYGASAPKVHIVEGEGGLTPGRVCESLAAAGTASLTNALIHIDWNQASIDSNHVCPMDGEPGEYVQWTPAELAYLHDWNVITVPDGTSFQQIVAAQRRAATLDTGQPTAIVYRTTKGWRYGMEGRASHGAGHKMCSPDFYQALAPLEEMLSAKLPRCDANDPPCARGGKPDVVEKCFWDALTLIRKALEDQPDVVAVLARRLVESRERLDRHERKPREGAPRVESIFEAAEAADAVPPELRLEPGSTATLRGELGKALNHYNRLSGGAFLIAAADLLGSTSVATGGKGFPEGFWNARSNPGARLLSIGGICEDAIAGVMSGLSSYDHHIGVGSSYGAFIAPLGHIAARLHAIGNQARQYLVEGPYRPFVLVLAHAGLKTGEDGPTHADPQALQLIQENFPRDTLISLTPWDPQEIWPLFSAALAKRPAVITPVVTRPGERVLDRAALGLAPVQAACDGVYLLRKARGTADGTLVLQGSGVAYAFVEEALGRLIDDGIDLDVYYVASAELFDRLPIEEQDRIYPEEKAREALGITGFTLPTLFRWVTSSRGRRASLHPFMKGHFPGSGSARSVFEEAGLDGESQYHAVRRFLDAR